MIFPYYHEQYQKQQPQKVDKNREQRIWVEALDFK